MDLGSEAKFFKGYKDIICRETGRSMHYFQGSREHRPPWGPPQWLCFFGTKTAYVLVNYFQLHCLIRSLVKHAKRKGPIGR